MIKKKCNKKTLGLTLRLVNQYWALFVSSQVNPDQIRDTTFCFTPNKLGYMPLRVNLTTTSIPGDGVERMLLVEVSVDSLLG